MVVTWQNVKNIFARHFTIYSNAVTGVVTYREIKGLVLEEKEFIQLFKYNFTIQTLRLSEFKWTHSAFLIL